MNRFWQTKSLAQMTQLEWEALCDGCGKCCLHKLLEATDDSGADAPADSDLYMAADETLYYTDVRCQFLDPHSAQCQCYAKRLELVDMCVNITLADLPRIHFMPTSCAYRRLHEGKGLPDWHPLLHGGSQTAMLAAQQSVRNYRTVSELEVDDDDLDLHIVRWPLNDA